MYSQLFKEKPTKELIIKLISCFGFTGLDDANNLNLNTTNSQEKILKYKELESELSNNYIEEI